MREALRLALAAFEDKKAFDIVLLDISKVASFASYFLMCSGDSSRQIQAIADEVEKKLKENGIRPNHIEVYRHAEWILLDYVDVVVHIFSKSARAYYDLERLWRDGKRLDAQKLLNTRARKVPASSRK
jgi:ribosome-associated protein